MKLNCARCQIKKNTVEVETGFAGEVEFLCGECVSIERYQMETAAAETVREKVILELETLISEFDKMTTLGSKEKKAGYISAMKTASSFARIIIERYRVAALRAGRQG